MNGGMHFPPDYINYDSRLVRAFNRTASRAAPSSITCSAASATPTSSSSPTPAHKPPCQCANANIKTLVENGVDLHLWQPKTYPDAPAPPQPTRFLFAGRLVDWKGVDILIDATARAPPVPLQLEIVGEGKLPHALEARVAELNLGNTITFTGWISQPDLARRMSAADVFVLPSLRECGGAVILEAMASALPTIALNWGGPATTSTTKPASSSPPPPANHLSSTCRRR